MVKLILLGGGKIGKSNPLGDSYAYQDFIQYVIDAEELGFESAFMVEHHFTGSGQLSASLALLTYLAARTKTIRLGSAVIVLPWHNPVLLAEQVGTLASLAQGRFIMQCGIGDAHQSRGHGADPRQRAARFEESLAICRSPVREVRSAAGERAITRLAKMSPPTILVLRIAVRVPYSTA